jgi:hypothetical protein
MGDENDVKKKLNNTFSIAGMNGYMNIKDTNTQKEIIKNTYNVLKECKTWDDYKKNTSSKMNVKAVLEVLQPDVNIRESILNELFPPQPTFAELNAEIERKNLIQIQLNKVKIEEEERKKAEEQRRINEAIAKQKKEKEDELNNIRSKNEITQDEYNKLQGHEKNSGQYNFEVRNQDGNNIMYYVKNPDYNTLRRISR